MYERLSEMLAQATVPELATSPVLQEALRISGIALVGIFFVMGLFAGMIILLAKLFPANDDEVM